MTKFEELMAVCLMLIACFLSAMLAQQMQRNDIERNLIKECKAVPWKHEPPVRPSCEEMAPLRLEQLLEKGICEENGL